ncbi:ABC transporter ATP-binding protein [Bacillus dakarensis]|uniref:ABC transporter ATP-binding protein n=1 Tax=Robertmurraya dakarensis TaxID=1926278 RepID=UPI0011159401|nr:ABC transporter ATP-binding protein [Bacillus dakarensis]
MSSLLQVQDLQVGWGNKKKFTHILDNVSFTVKKGEAVGIVGESGCGKSMTALSIMGLLPANIEYDAGSIQFGSTDLTKLTQNEMNKIRGKDISMVFQEPMTSLNPSFTIGNQLAEAFKYHSNYSKQEIREKSIEVLKKVRVPDPAQKLDVYPHNLSGGLRQRVMIAIALACNPKILIADEPTTALDVTIQAQILDLMNDLRQTEDMAIMMITHDLGVVAETCDRAIVMYAGQVIEEATVEELFEAPYHPYTRGLMLSAPQLGELKEKLHVIPGTVPDIGSVTKGCRFAERCELATNLCREETPQLEEFDNERKVRCWHKMT